MNKLHLLVIDDEPQIRRLLERGLSSYGYTVVSAPNGQDGIALAAQIKPAAIILDMDLRSIPDGVGVCKAVREWSAIPILILSVADSKTIKLAALNAGADDYITKPFDMDELEARIRAVIRRAVLTEATNPEGTIQVRDLLLDLVRRRVSFKAKEIHLTPTEYELLRILASHPGRVVTNKTLLDAIWRDQKEPPAHYLRVYINMLRKKLEERADSPFHYIITEPGIGYRFADLS